MVPYDGSLEIVITSEARNLLLLEPWFLLISRAKALDQRPLVTGALKRSFPRINAGASATAPESRKPELVGSGLRSELQGGLLMQFAANRSERSN